MSKHTFLRDVRAIPLKESLPDEEKNSSGTVLGDLRKRESRLVSKLKRLYDLYAESDDAILLETIRENSSALSDVRELIREESERGLLSAQRSRMRQEISEVSDLWDYMTVSEQRSFLQKIINRITVKGKNILIDYNF